MDTVAWRQWHHWNKLDSLTTIQINKGKHVLTLHIAEHGNMNFDYLQFSRKQQTIKEEHKVLKCYVRYLLKVQKAATGVIGFTEIQ